MTTHMIMDDRDRERLWGLLLPTHKTMREAHEAMPLFSMRCSGTFADPEGRFPASLAVCRKQLDNLERLYQQAQRIHAEFKPKFPLVPLVGAQP